MSIDSAIYANFGTRFRHWLPKNKEFDKVVGDLELDSSTTKGFVLAISRKNDDR